MTGFQAEFWRSLRAENCENGGHKNKIFRLKRPAAPRATAALAAPALGAAGRFFSHGAPACSLFLFPQCNGTTKFFAFLGCMPNFLKKVKKFFAPFPSRGGGLRCSGFLASLEMTRGRGARCARGGMRARAAREGMRARDRTGSRILYRMREVYCNCFFVKYLTF